jgi:hypothetical protein
VEIVVGIIEVLAILLKWLCAQYGVEHDALHAVAVSGFPGDTQQIPGELEVRIRAARSFKAVMSVGQACSIACPGRLGRAVLVVCSRIAMACGSLACVRESSSPSSNLS